MAPLTQTLLASDDDGFRRATQSRFLELGARGALPKDVLGRWLANDRLYIHGYIRGIGRTLTFLRLPETVPTTSGGGGSGEVPRTPAVRLLDWLASAVVNIRREEDFFVATAARYGIDVNLPAGPDGRVPQEAKLEGLRRFEALFDAVAPPADDGAALPWLESAVVFWGTERCYLDAWRWAKGKLDGSADGSADADGGALRKEFIGNWTSDEFAAWVDELGTIVDDAVSEVVEARGEGVFKDITERALGKWRELLAAEQAFWPEVQ